MDFVIYFTRENKKLVIPFAEKDLSEKFFFSLDFNLACLHNFFFK